MIHRLLLITLLLVFGLITLGGVVHNTESSLACPDWPLCFGEVMPVMEGGVAIEHSHRLLATFIGMLTIAIVVLAVRRRREDPYTAKLSWIALALVVGQGALGGITVILKLPTLVSTAHLGTSMLFFCVLVVIAHRTRPGLTRNQPDASAAYVVRWLTIAFVAVYAQMLLGALVRHTGSGAAAGLGPDAVLSGFDLGRGEKDLWPGDGPGRLHMSHRFVALLVTAILAVAGHKTFYFARRMGWRPVQGMILLVMALLASQLFLGAASIWTFLNIPLVTAHLSVGAALLIAIQVTRLMVVHPQPHWSRHTAHDPPMPLSNLATDGGA